MIWWWPTFRQHNEYGEVPVEDWHKLPVEQNPFFPWWWRFSVAEVLAVVLIVVGSGSVLLSILIAWLLGANI